MTSPIKVAFLDRDGVINHDAGYTHKIEDFQFINGVVDALRQLQSSGYQLIIVTNQSGIGRGYYSEEAYQVLTSAYLDKLANYGVSVLDVFHCPHLPTDQCDCRKPLPGLFNQAARRYKIDFPNSLMVGDKVSDMQAATAANVPRSFLISSQNKCGSINKADGYIYCRSLLDCVQTLIAR